MRYPASEKHEIIRTVEASHLPVKRTLAMLGIPTSTYSDWYARWVEGGFDALADQPPRPRSVWNRIPDEVRRDVVEFALEHEDLTARELAVKTPTRSDTSSRNPRRTASSRPRTSSPRRRMS
jgi:putative transposase